MNTFLYKHTVYTFGLDIDNHVDLDISRQIAALKEKQDHYAIHLGDFFVSEEITGE